MANLILPRRFTQQPQGAVEIDTSGRLFDLSKLSAVLNPAVSPEYNLATGIMHSTSGLTLGASSQGKTYAWNKTLQFVDIGAANIVLDTASCTVLIATVRIDATTDSGASHGYSVTATDRALIHLPFTDNNIYWDYGNATAGSGRLSTSMAAYMAAGTVNIWGFVAGSRGREIWRNGRLISSNTSATASRPSTTRKYYVGGIDDFPSGRSPSDHTSLFVLSRDQWSQTALQELTTDPWQIFRRRKRVLYFDVAAGGIPTLSFPAATSITASSAVPQVTLTF